MLSRFPFVVHAGDLVAAADLLHTLGSDAVAEAACRADRAREIGNYVAFCRWRQLERLIDWLDDDAVRGTLH